MEKYKKQLKNKNMMSLIGILGMSSAIILSNRFFPESIDALPSVTAFIEGFQLSLIIFFAILMFTNMYKINLAMKDEERLKDMQIEDNDERNIKIQKEVSAATSSIFLGVLAIATVVSGYFNHVDFFSLLGALFVYVTIKAICKVIFRNKY